jgi:hypothetical protein
VQRRSAETDAIERTHDQIIDGQRRRIAFECERGARFDGEFVGEPNGKHHAAQRVVAVFAARENLQGQIYFGVCEQTEPRFR